MNGTSPNDQKKSPTQSISTDHQRKPEFTAKKLPCITTLCFLNLMNFMDRYTIAGVLDEVQEFYDINDSEAGFLQTVFVITYMVFAPINGFLGDRYNRKLIMCTGVIIWVGAVLASSFIPNNHFYIFLILRGVVGIREASYAIIAPTIIGDLFTGNTRSRVLMVFYCCVPVGSGLGYVIGSEVSKLTGDWQWGIRVTPAVGVLCVLALVFFVEEPVRGAAEAEAGAKDATMEIKSSYLEDVKYLISVKTFLFTTVGSILVVFNTGTLAWWAPTAILYGKAAEQNVTDINDKKFKDENDSSLVFGALTCLGGIVGVTVGIIVAQLLKEGKGWFRVLKTDRADSIICGVGSTLAIPFMIIGLRAVNNSPTFGWICVFFTVTFLSLNWAVIVDILLYTIVPRRRNLASAWQISLSHLFGDASGPYIVGLVSDAIRGSDNSTEAHFHSLLDSFYIPAALLIVSAMGFFLSAKTIIHDKQVVEHAMGYRTKSAKVGDIMNRNIVESSRL